jgi:hypothetical protein
MATIPEKNEPFGEPGSFAPGGRDADVERRSSTIVAGRKMSRIGPPPRNSSLPVLDDTSSGEEYNKLVEMEAHDAIKYRTCSWQKVRLRARPYNNKWNPGTV